MEAKSSGSGVKTLIIVASVAIPLVVALLYFTPKLSFGVDLDFLPLVNAIVNGTTFIVLCAALYFVKQGDIDTHRKLMKSAIALSLVFLVSYVSYHMTHDSTKFQGEGVIEYVYKTILLTHILLAIVIVPLVLITYVRAISDKIDKHRKIAKITMPIWMYVTLTGVIVYIMIMPYYK